MRIGQKFGRVIGEAEVAGIVLSESMYLPETRIDKHVHERFYFCTLLRGSYRELYARRERNCTTSTVVFHPAHEIHSTHFGTRGGRLFRCELSREWLTRFGQAALAGSPPVNFNGGNCSLLNLKLYREFRQADDASQLAIEGLVLEIVAELVRRQSGNGSKHRPKWLTLAEQMLHDSFRQNLTVSDVALEVGVHPVHFARVFRRLHGCSVGEHVRRLRIESAIRQLSATDDSLAEIATAHGFVDPSHFSQSFKLATGFTPGVFRS